MERLKEQERAIERLKEQERAIEANKLVEAKLALVEEALRMEQEKNKQIMAVHCYSLILIFKFYTCASIMNRSLIFLFLKKIVLNIGNPRFPG